MTAQIKDDAKTIIELKRKNATYFQEILSLKTWALWDEKMHKIMQTEMIEDGLVEFNFNTDSNPELIAMFDLEDDLINEKEDVEPISYYSHLMKTPSLESQHLDLSKPLGFFGSQMQLSFTERINVLEREAVRFYKVKQMRFEEETKIRLEFEAQARDLEEKKQIKMA